MDNSFFILISLIAWGIWCFFIGWKIRGDVDKSRKEEPSNEEDR